MKAFILAAGVSRRLYPHTYNTAKCLIDVGGKPIIHYQLDALESLGITDVTMIVGYRREMLTEHVTSQFPNMKFNFLTNHHYFETNTAYSVYLGREILSSDEQVLMNADVVYPKELLEKTDVYFEDVSEFPCLEIDFLEDLETARKLF